MMDANGPKLMKLKKMCVMISVIVHLEQSLKA